MSKDNGLERRFEVKKLTNPSKQVECIVLEFDDPIAQKAIRYLAELMYYEGFTEAAKDTLEKLEKFIKVERFAFSCPQCGARYFVKDNSERLCNDCGEKFNPQHK